MNRSTIKLAIALATLLAGCKPVQTSGLREQVVPEDAVAYFLDLCERREELGASTKYVLTTLTKRAFVSENISGNDPFAPGCARVAEQVARVDDVSVVVRVTDFDFEPINRLPNVLVLSLNFEVVPSTLV